MRQLSVFVVLGVLAMNPACKKESGLLPVDSAPTAPSAPSLPAGHPPIDGMHAAAPGGTGSASDGGEISGVIDIDPALAAHVKAGDTIFVIARNGATGGMVAATKLVAPAQFPVPFTLSNANTMPPGGPFSGPLRLSARVDKDGDAGSKNPGDVVGENPDQVPVPSHSVKVMLTKIL